MNFKTNLNKLTLLSNDIIKIYFDDKTVEFVPPSIRLYLNDLDFQEFKFFLKQDAAFLEKVNINFSVSNEYEVFLAILKTDYKTQQFINYFLLLFPNLEYKNSRFEINGMPLTAEEYKILIDILEVSCAEKDYKEFMKTLEPENSESAKKKELSALEKRMKETQEKLESIKKGKTKAKDNKQGTITIDQIVIGILYEFPSLRIEEIFSMNMFTLLDFWHYVGKIVDTQIQIEAAGNGLTKEFTYFIN